MIPEDWYNLLMPVLPGADRDHVARQVLQAAAEFCREAPVWIETLPPIDLEADRDTYPVVPPIGTSIGRILTVRYHDRLLPPLRQTDILTDTASHGWWWDAAKGLVIRPVPRAPEDRALTVTATLWPLTLEALPFALLRRWQEDIAHGVWGRLMMNTHAPYGNPAMAEYHLRRFRSAIARARIEAYTGTATHILRVPMPRELM